MDVTTLLPQLLICSPSVHKTLLLLTHMNSLTLCSCTASLLQPTFFTLIKSDLHFAISLEHIFSALDLQTASTPRPFNVSCVVPTG
jgi:hypothetical protein